MRAKTKGLSIVTAPALLVAALMALPISYLIMRAAASGGDALEIIAQAETVKILFRTLMLALSVMLATLAIALPVAWLTVRTDMPGKKILSVLTALPLVVPSYVSAIALISAFGPRGLVQQMLEEPFGVERLPEIYGFPGAWLALTLSTFPYLLLTIRGALMGMDPALEEASRSLGKGKFVTFVKVTLPHLRPAIAAGGLLITLYVLSDFGAVALMGFDSFTRVIFVQFEAAFERTTAIALSCLLGIFTIGLVIAEQSARGRARYHSVGAGTQKYPYLAKLGKGRWLAFAFCVFIVLISLGMPIAVLIYWLSEGLSRNVEVEFPMQAIMNGIYVSGFSALFAIIAAIPVIVLAVRSPGKLSRTIEVMTWTGFALPGIVVALSLVFFGINVATPFYQTLPMLIFAYCVLFLPVATGAVRTSLLQVNPNVEEASRSLGKTPLRTLLRVTLPMVAPGIIVGAALVFLTSMKELPATLMLAPAGFRTLATQLWAATEAASYTQAAVPALLLILVSAIPVGLLLYKERKG